MNFTIKFYKDNKLSDEYFKIINTNIKPSVGDFVRINEEIYKVKKVIINYDSDEGDIRITV